jgi:tetratricopeptide (TPR) repeat protein
MRMLGRCMLEVGDAELSLDELARARERFLEGGDVLSSLLAKDGDDAEALSLQAAQLGRLGDVEHALGQTAKAYQLMLGGLVASRKLMKLTGESPQALRVLSVALNKVSNLERAVALLAQARGRSQESVQVCERLVGLVGETPDSTRDLHVALLNVGQACAGLGDHHEAIAHLERAAEVAESRAALVEVDAQSLRDLSVIQTNLGQVNLTVGHISAARRNFRQALAEIVKAEELTGTSWSLSRDKARNYMSLGYVERADGDLPHAAELYSRAEALLRRRGSEPGLPAYWRRYLGFVLEGSGDLARDRGDRIKAEQFHAERLALAMEMLEHDPDLFSNRLDVALAHGRLGDLCRDEGDNRPALEHYNRQLEVLQSIGSSEIPTVHWRFAHEICLRNIGDMMARLGAVPAAVIAWSNSWAMLRQLPPSYEWWPLELSATSERVINAVKADALTLRQAFVWREAILVCLYRHLELSSAESLLRSWPHVRQLHYLWLGLALSEALSKIPEFLGSLHGRKLLAFAMSVQDARVEDAGKASGLLDDARRMGLQQELAELRMQLRTAEAVGQIMQSHLPTGSAERDSAGDSADVLARDSVAAAFDARLKEYRGHVLPGLLAGETDGTGLPSVGVEFIREVLSPDEAVLILFQPASSVPLADPDDARPQGYLMTKRPTWGFLGPKFKGERLALDGLQDAAAAVRHIGSAGEGRAGHRSGGVPAEVDGAQTAPSTDRLDEVMDSTFWTRVVPRLEGIKTLHIVPHAELHVLPFGEAAPVRTKKGIVIDVHVHPGLVTFWLMTRDRQAARSRNAPSSVAGPVHAAEEARVAAVAYSPPSGPRPPIPFVHAEVNALRLLWPEVHPMRGAAELDILHLAGHGSGAELETGPGDWLGLHQLLRSGVRPRVVYCSACLVGKIDEDLDGDPLGLVVGFILKTARFVVAPSVPVSDVHSPLLSVPFHVALKEQHERGEALDAHCALRQAKDQLRSGALSDRTTEILRSVYAGVMKQELERVLAEAEAGRVDSRVEVARLMTAWVEPTSGFRAVHADLDGPASAVFDTDGAPSTRAEAGAAAAAKLLLRDSAKLATLPEVQTLLRFVNVYGAPQGLSRRP